MVIYLEDTRACVDFEVDPPPRARTHMLLRPPNGVAKADRCRANVLWMFLLCGATAYLVGLYVSAHDRRSNPPIKIEQKVHFPQQFTAQKSFYWLVCGYYYVGTISSTPARGVSASDFQCVFPPGVSASNFQCAYDTTIFPGPFLIGGALQLSGCDILPFRGKRLRLL